jgi:outer membrane protein assembly factor BamB
VLELSPSLRLQQYFAPTSWPQNNASDLDMSMAPALLSNGQVVLSGKSRIVYLLNGARLGGIGGEQASLANACTDDIAGGSAVAGRVVYLPCLSGTVAIRVGSSPASIKLLWSANVASGPPIVAAGMVWTVGSNGVLFGLDPGSGVVRRQVNLGPQANHFPTPSVGAGLLVATTANRVVAFHASPRG